MQNTKGGWGLVGERESSYTSTPLWKETKEKLFERKAN